MSPWRTVYAKESELVNRIVKPVVEATTVGFMPSSSKSGLMTIPPPIPNIPARVPAMIEKKEICIALLGEILYSDLWKI